MKKLYYIGDNLTSNDPQGLTTGVMIIAIKPNLIFESPDLDGPYESINQLKKRSKIFKELAKTNPKRVQKILQTSNISTINDYILTENPYSVSKTFMKSIEHIIRGDIKLKKVYGVHYFDSDIMKIINIIKKEDINNVWEAKVSVYSKDNNSWYEKYSTFFPKSWTLTIIFEECEYAYRNKKKMVNMQYVFSSRTKSNVPVEIIIQGDNIKSIYPIYTNNKVANKRIKGH